MAIIRYQQDMGNLPESLEVLQKSEYLKQIPIDPYSDEPLVYKVTDDGFMLYSVGENFIDDGGKQGILESGRVKRWIDNGDTVFWPIQK